jgi:hypothetical protein
MLKRALRQILALRNRLRGFVRFYDDAFDTTLAQLDCQSKANRPTANDRHRDRTQINRARSCHAASFLQVHWESMPNGRMDERPD